MDGVLIVDKPEGPTSHDVVARVRRAVGIKKIGHTGTLDPLATGVLALVVGRATRMARFLAGSDKEYDATIRLGVESDTYDAGGCPIERDGPDWRTAPRAAMPSRAAIEETLGQFRGTFLQQPPPFSAKKVGGRRAHRLARRGEAVELAPVAVTVHRLDLVACENETLRVTVVCSPGFYVRSLAHELGRRLGVGARLDRLRRTRSGTFGLEQALPLSTIEREGPAALVRMIPMNEVLPEWPAVRLTPEGARRVSHGGDVAAGALADPRGAIEGPAPGWVRLMDARGELLALAQRQPGTGALHPVVVLV